MNPATPSTRPRILLVEDDPVSAAYLSDAAAALPALVDTAASMSEALTVAGARRPDVLLIDAHLPDGRGEILLQHLRTLGVDAPALAHTASTDAVLHDRLRDAGFAEVLCKPLGIAELNHALQRQLPSREKPPAAGDLPCWDDEVAMAALGGAADHVAALRGLFHGELPGQRERIAGAIRQGDAVRVRDELHRLAASCGFVGAARLGQAVRNLQALPLDAGAWAALDGAIAEILASA